jgi:hypothetical protein
MQMFALFKQPGPRSPIERSRHPNQNGVNSYQELYWPALDVSYRPSPFSLKACASCIRTWIQQGFIACFYCLQVRFIGIYVSYCFIGVAMRRSRVRSPIVRHAHLFPLLDDRGSVHEYCVGARCCLQASNVLRRGKFPLAHSLHAYFR